MLAGTVTCTTEHDSFEWEVEYDPAETPYPVPGQKLKEFARLRMSELETNGNPVLSVCINQQTDPTDGA